MPRYPQIESGQWVYPRMGGYRMACCDCGLVHELEFQIEDDGEHIRMRAFRNNRSTAQIRRRMAKEN